MSENPPRPAKKAVVENEPKPTLAELRAKIVAEIGNKNLVERVTAAHEKAREGLQLSYRFSRFKKHNPFVEEEKRLKDLKIRIERLAKGEFVPDWKKTIKEVLIGSSPADRRFESSDANPYQARKTAAGDVEEHLAVLEEISNFYDPIPNLEGTEWEALKEERKIRKKIFKKKEERKELKQKDRAYRELVAGVGKPKSRTKVYDPETLAAPIVPKRAEKENNIAAEPEATPTKPVKKSASKSAASDTSAAQPAPKPKQAPVKKSGAREFEIDTREVTPEPKRRNPTPAQFEIMTAEQSSQKEQFLKDLEEMGESAESFVPLNEAEARAEEVREKFLQGEATQDELQDAIVDALRTANYEDGWRGEDLRKQVYAGVMEELKDSIAERERRMELIPHEEMERSAPARAPEPAIEEPVVEEEVEEAPVVEEEVVRERPFVPRRYKRSAAPVPKKRSKLRQALIGLGVLLGIGAAGYGGKTLRDVVEDGSLRATIGRVLNPEPRPVQPSGTESSRIEAPPEQEAVVVQEQGVAEEEQAPRISFADAAAEGREIVVSPEEMEDAPPPEPQGHRGVIAPDATEQGLPDPLRRR